MWYTLARPQPDGRDISLLAQYENNRTGWVKATPNTAVTLLDGTIAVYAGPRLHRGMGPNARAATSEEITAAWATEQEKYLRAWDVGCEALKHYLDEYWAYEMVNDDGSLRHGAGCSSGHISFDRDPEVTSHCVQVTKTDLQGCAQGIFHEYAHLRLETLGIEVETHDGILLLNGPDELYDSSVRFDIKRPMSAVLHGVYAWLMFTENDYHVYQANACGCNPSHAKSRFIQYSQHNIPKIQNGIAEIQRYGKFTPEGAEFIRGVYDWADDLCARCTALY